MEHEGLWPLRVVNLAFETVSLNAHPRSDRSQECVANLYRLRGGEVLSQHLSDSAHKAGPDVEGGGKNLCRFEEERGNTLGTSGENTLLDQVPNLGNLSADHNSFGIEPVHDGG